MKGPPTVGVVGGGIAGLSCAHRLQELGLAVTLYDTGKRGTGGRCSSRLWNGKLPVDHASQVAEARTASFQELLATLQKEGKTRRLGDDAVTSLKVPGVATPLGKDAIPRYIGVGGMGAIADALAAGLEDVRTDVWVSPNGGIRRNAGDGSWIVKEGKGVESRYDAVIVAHNGKCAERLTSRQPSSRVHALLRAKFAPRAPKTASPGSGRMTLNSMYSLLFEVPKGLMPADLGAVNYVTCDPTLRLLANNHAKHAPGGGADEPTEVWTALSSGAFGKAHKAAQEFIEGTEVETEVTNLMLEAVGRAVGLGEDAIPPSRLVASKLQLWGAAVPITAWDGGAFAWDADCTIGICGDWLMPAEKTDSYAAPSTIESAWLSGQALAEHMADAELRATSHGLQLGEGGGRFVPVDAGGFGEGGTAGASAWVSAPGASSPRSSSPPNTRRRDSTPPKKAASSDQLFVRNVPYAASEGEIQELFATAGKVVFVKLLEGSDGRPRGQARVRMESASDAQAALALDGRELGGRSIKVQNDERRKVG